MPQCLALLCTYIKYVNPMTLYLPKEAKVGKKRPRMLRRSASSWVRGLYQRRRSLANSFWLRTRPLNSSLQMPSPATPLNSGLFKKMYGIDWTRMYYIYKLNKSNVSCQHCLVPSDQSPHSRHSNSSTSLPLRPEIRPSEREVSEWCHPCLLAPPLPAPPLPPLLLPHHVWLLLHQRHLVNPEWMKHYTTIWASETTIRSNKCKPLYYNAISH